MLEYTSVCYSISTSVGLELKFALVIWAVVCGNCNCLSVSKTDYKIVISVNLLVIILHPVKPILKSDIFLFGSGKIRIQLV